MHVWSSYLAKYLHILRFLHVFEEAVFPDLFSILCWVKLDVSLSKFFSVGSFLSQSDNSIFFSTPTCVILLELIPSLVPDTWSKSWKYALVWGAYLLLLLLCFACFEESFRFLILSLQCRINFVGPAVSTETFVLTQTSWLLALAEIFFSWND